VSALLLVAIVRALTQRSIVEKLKALAREQRCYKAILNCSERNAPFYEKCGFQKKEVQMAHYF
jgi:glucosamine-phosphate N-acetyltransferase